MRRDEFRRVADEVAAEIGRGALRPGERLPTQRAFARARGIANSTAIRVYGELTRRGLVVGEVGRGTFVRAAAPGTGAAALTERVAPDAAVPGGGTAGPPPGVNLELNYPVTAGQSELMSKGLAPLLRPDVLLDATRTAAPAGTPQAREAAARVLARAGWRPDPERVLFAGNGRQAIAAALASLCGPGGRAGVEDLTYPLVRSIAERIGVRLVPVATDGEGLIPAALAEAHRSAPLAAVYVQPTLQNPLSVTAGDRRRAQLAAAVREYGIVAVEDTTWAFLAPEAPAPLAAYAPERTVLVDSLSKRLAPGLTVGMLAAPPELLGTLADGLRSGAWTAPAFHLEAAVRWTADGTVAAVVDAKRADAAARQRILHERLGADAAGRVRAGGRIRTDPRAYYCWWDLPSRWRAETFVAAAAARGVAVTPGPAFAAGGQRVPDAVRIGLASPPPEVLGAALGVLAEVVSGAVGAGGR
ncbi:PLP-dependent aminotransferase family protein [Streptomyces sp. NPDC087300]|uniref:aminotransferase-like domain-containing protein n=1 Tax=Streptomyces sp. NPDC087300 TaxID=3365780 RepID=UPI0038266B89